MGVSALIFCSNRLEEALTTAPFVSSLFTSFFILFFTILGFDSSSSASALISVFIFLEALTSFFLLLGLTSSSSSTSVLISLFKFLGTLTSFFFPSSSSVSSDFTSFLILFLGLASFVYECSFAFVPD